MKNIDDDINWKERYVNLVNFISHKNEETQFYYEDLKNSGLERLITFLRGKLRAYNDIMNHEEYFINIYSEKDDGNSN